MKGRIMILLAVMVLGFLSCKDNKKAKQACTQNDWVGAWEPISSNCDDKFGRSIKIISKGSQGNIIVLDNDRQVIVNDCSFKLFNEASHVIGSLENDAFSATITENEGYTCTIVYKKK